MTESATQKAYICIAALLAIVGGVIAGTYTSGAFGPVLIWTGIATIVAYRSIVRRQFSRTSSPSISAERDEPTSDLFRVPRLVYYTALSLSGLLLIRPAFGITLSDWIFLLSLVLTFALLLIQKDTKGSWFRLPLTLYLGVGAFALGGFLSSINAPLPLQSASVVVKFLYLTILWFGLGTVILRTAPHIRVAICCWVLGTALSGAISIVQLAGFEVFHTADKFYGREAGAGGNPNDLGAQCAIALVPAIAAVTSDWVKGRWRIALALAVVCLLAGLILSGSNTAFLAAALSVFLWFGAMGKINGRSILLVVAGVIAVAGILDFQSDQGALSPLDRFQNATDQDGAYCSSCARIQASKVAWEEIQDQPLVGRGLDEIGNRTADGLQVHLMALKAWYEAGILGFVGIILVLGSIIVVGVRCVRYASSLPNFVIALALIASFAAFIGVGLAQPLLYERYAWIPAALIMAVYAQHCRAINKSFGRKAPGEADVAVSWSGGTAQKSGL